MRRDLSTPVWAIETYRHQWLAFAEDHRQAFAFYRSEFYAKRPEYPWGFHVSGFHQEVVHQTRLRLSRQEERDQLAISNNADLFLTHLDELTSVRFQAIHRQGGFPNLNDTARTRAFVGQSLLFAAEGATVDDETMLLFGCTLDPVWEKPPVGTVVYIADKKRVWNFSAEDAEMTRVLEQYRRMG